MSNAFTPIFEMQRTMVEQSRKAVLDSIESQNVAFETLTEGMESSRSLGERSTELTRSAAHAYVDAVEGSMPADAGEFDFEELHRTIDESFDAYEQGQDETIDALVAAVEESNAAYEEFSEGYTEAVDSSFDALVESHERFEETFDRFAETAQTAD
jgi:hypothetical protein